MQGAPGGDRTPAPGGPAGQTSPAGNSK
jgi:hypothetical protein